MRQTGGGVCRLNTPIACCAFPKEGSVEKSLSYQARRALLQQTVPQYCEASSAQKRTLLDAFVAVTGYHRTYARWLLNHAEEVQQTLRRPRPAQYGPEVQHALFLAWNAANRICAKRLIPFLPTLLEGCCHGIWWIIRRAPCERISSWFSPHSTVQEGTSSCRSTRLYLLSPSSSRLLPLHGASSHFFHAHMVKHGTGGRGWYSTSRTVQHRLVLPAAIAGVRCR